MDIYEIRTKYQDRKLTDIPLTIAYYARVSTEKEEQLNALDNQLSYYEDYIKSCENWTLYKGYVDEGITGTSTKNREQFNLMLKDASEGKFDLVITKEISRFARNTLDSIKYTRELLKNGVAVFFKEDNINTLDPDSELRLTIMASLAQDESRRISQRVRVGHSIAQKNGHILGTDNMYGYHKSGAKLTIVEKEAEMIRLIFSLYASGEYGTRQIEQILFEKGYRNKNGATISRTVIGNIIKNPKYKGYVCGGKVKIVDMFTKKQKFLDESEWLMWKDETGERVPAIVDEELWERANLIFSKRSNEVKVHSGRPNNRNLFTSKIQCAIDGKNYKVKYRTLHGKKCSPVWGCAHKLDNGSHTCPSFGIKEEVLIEVMRDVISTFTANYDKITERYLTLYETSIAKDENLKKINKAEEKLKKLEQQQSELLDFLLEKTISKTNYIAKEKSISEKIAIVRDEIKKLTIQSKSNKSKLDEIAYVRNYVKKFAQNSDCEITSKIIDSLIEKIIINPIDEYTATISVILIGKAEKEYQLTKKNRNYNLRTLDCMFNNIYTKVNRKITYPHRCSMGHMKTLTYTLKIYI